MRRSIPGEVLRRPMKNIAVVGATGAQGGGLVRAIQNDEDSAFQARAITRDASSEKAEALAAQQ